MNYRKITLSASVIAFVSALVFGGTQAFFSDEEVSEGNVFAAGAIDLLVDSEAHYAGMVCVNEGTLENPDYRWQEDDNPDTDLTREELLDTECSGTWEESDLGPSHTFFDYSDLKPGDDGENTISLHVIDNDAYACVIIDNMQDDDNGLNEPEEEAGDSTGGDGEGELSQELRFFAWDDDGDNLWEDGEDILFSNTEGPASDVIDGVVYPLYTPDLNNGAVLQGTTTEYIGLYWCYGDIDVNEDANELSCDGAGASNLTQSDSLMADITFYAEQARNNEDFECPALEDGEEQVIDAEGPSDGWNSPDTDLVWQAEGRFGNNALNGDWEVGVGNNTQDSGQSENTQNEWEDGTAVPFSVVYDGNEATFTVDGNAISDVVGATEPDDIMNIIAGKVSAGAGDSVELTELELDGTPISPSSLTDTDNANAKYLVISSEDLSGGFTLTGMVAFDWTPAETSGSRPAFQVQIRD